MKNRKKSLIIGFIIIILIFIIGFFINQKSESNNQSCSIDNDCETPFEYLIRSDCPYESKCIQNTCTIICPDFEGNWGKIKDAIYNCEVESIFQAHSLNIEAQLKNGKIIKAIEPSIDDILNIAKEAEDKCGKIIMATE